MLIIVFSIYSRTTTFDWSRLTSHKKAKKIKNECRNQERIEQYAVLYYFSTYLFEPFIGIGGMFGYLLPSSESRVNCVL